MTSGLFTAIKDDAVADTARDGPPVALHRGQSDLPFVPYQEGVTFQLNQVDIEAGFFVVRVRGEPGRTIQRHKHTGEIFAFTLAGSWKYLEYPEINTAGSYLYEPAGSVHTLHFPETNTETTDVWFVLHGANLNLDAEGNVESVLDASAALEVYRAACRDGGLPEPDVIGALTPAFAHPKVKAKASAPGSRNSMVKVRSRT